MLSTCSAVSFSSLQKGSRESIFLFNPAKKFRTREKRAFRKQTNILQSVTRSILIFGLFVTHPQTNRCFSAEFYPDFPILFPCASANLISRVLINIIVHLYCTNTRTPRRYFYPILMVCEREGRQKTGTAY